MNDLLKALAESDRDREAPAAVEMRLRAAFRRKHAHPKWPYAIAAAVLMAVGLASWPKAQTMRIAVAAPPVAMVPTTGKLAEVAKIAPRRPSPPREVVTEFFPLMDAAQPFDGGELLRVSLPASAMRSVGLPVSEERLTDTVQADVLVGEEGLARAIRFVRSVN